MTILYDWKARYNVHSHTKNYYNRIHKRYRIGSRTEMRNRVMKFLIVIVVAAISGAICGKIFLDNIIW